jgi:transcription elongation factor GreA
VLDLESDSETTYELVIAENADASKGRISIASPVARGLMGKEEGDEVRVRTPAGVRNFEIVSVRTLHDRRDDDGSEG